MAGSFGRSSPFAVVGAGLVVFIVLIVRHHHLSSLLVGRVRRLRAVVAVFDRVWWPLSAFADAFVVREWLGWALLFTGQLSWAVGGRSVVAWGFGSWWG